MKNQFFLLLFILLWASCTQPDPDFVTSDIDNFWQAYDKIVTTSDSASQATYLQELFLDKGTPGLKAIMQARRYTPDSYLSAINEYPLFWESIRENTLKAGALAGEIKEGVKQLKELYPALRPAKVYFTIGALRTGGTTLDSLVLIGGEIALADENTVTSELPERLGHLAPYFAGNPIDDIVFLNVHEYVHTQQIPTIGDNLLTQCLYEGTAEFLAEQATGTPSHLPALAYGKRHEAAVKERFSREMFAYSYDNWLWNDFENQFNMRDLGYYVGYAIAEKYYEAAPDQKQAIKTLIELDYTNREEVEALVDQAGYFSQSVNTSRQRIPTVRNILPFTNGSQNIDPSITEITLEFSTVMDQRFTNFELGPLGSDQVLRVQEVMGFAPDGKSVTFKVSMMPDHRYQLLIDAGFRSLDGVPLAPYLLDFKTK